MMLSKQSYLRTLILWLSVKQNLMTRTLRPNLILQDILILLDSIEINMGEAYLFMFAIVFLVNSYTSTPSLKISKAFSLNLISEKTNGYFLEHITLPVKMTNISFETWEMLLIHT